MWIVRLALRRPYTFVVAALVLLLLTPFVLLRTPTDNFVDHRVHVSAHSFQGQSGNRLEFPGHSGRRGMHPDMFDPFRSSAGSQPYLSTDRHWMGGFHGLHFHGLAIFSGGPGSL
jgi:hypothetical protein